MSTSCVTSATATTTSVFTSDTLTTTFTESVSTQPPTVTTITTEACALGVSVSSIACISTATTITSTISGGVTTVKVPVTETIPVTFSETLTLFGSSCTVITSGPLSLSQSSVISTSTPDPVVITTPSASTLSDGSISLVMQTITSSQSPSVVYVATTVPVQTQATQSNNDSSSSSNIGAIVGGVVGGFFGLLGIALVIWFVMKRRRRWDDIFDKEDADIAPPRRQRTDRFSLDADVRVEPKPYQYGLVGQSPSPGAGISPPNSPPSFGVTSLPRQHTLTPLQLPTSASTPGPSVTTVSSRPSTAGSMRPLRPDMPPSPPPLTHAHTTSSGSSTSVHVPALPSNWGHHGPSPSAGQEYFDRAGSPTSIREYEPPRRLQLANAADGERPQSPPTPSLGPAMLDGKGRNVRLGSGGPGVLVHTDAGPLDYRDKRAAGVSSLSDLA